MGVKFGTGEGPPLVQRVVPAVWKTSKLPLSKLNNRRRAQCCRLIKDQYGRSLDNTAYCYAQLVVSCFPSITELLHNWQHGQLHSATKLVCNMCISFPNFDCICIYYHPSGVKTWYLSNFHVWGLLYWPSMSGEIQHEWVDPWWPMQAPSTICQFLFRCFCTYCEPLHFHCLIILQIYVENFTAFLFHIFQTLILYADKSYGCGHIPEIHIYLISQFYTDCRNLIHAKYMCYTVLFSLFWQNSAWQSDSWCTMP